MRVLLIATNTETEPYPVFPLGMAVVARALEQAGHEVRQLDALADGTSERISAVCLDFAPEAVGISVRNLDNVDSLTSAEHWALDEVRATVALLRRITGAPIFMGGPGFSLMPEQILEHTDADHGIVGEGEEACTRFLDMLAAGQTPPRLLHGSRRLRGTEIHGAAADSAILDYYLSQSGILNLQTKRGCPHACIYCTYPSLEGGQIRAREPEAVIEDILRTTASHDVHEIFFTDSVFNDRDGHWLRLAEAMVRQNLTIPWSGFFQPEGLAREELHLCRRAGLKALELGTDATTNTTLRGLRKSFDFATVERVHRLCVEERMPCAHFVIFGGPGETDLTVREGLANLDRLEHGVVFAFLGIRVYAGTPLLRLAIQEGALPADSDCLEPTYYFSPHIDPAVTEKTLTQAFKGRRDRLFPPSKGQQHMAVMRNFGFRGILWDTLIRFPETCQPGVRHVR